MSKDEVASKQDTDEQTQAEDEPSTKRPRGKKSKSSKKADSRPQLLVRPPSESLELYGLDPEDGSESHQAGFSRDETESTREFPSLKAEEAWFVHDQSSLPLSVGHILAHEEQRIIIDECLDIQSYEQRYRVHLDGSDEPLLLRRGRRSAPFLRYELEMRALSEIAEDDPCEVLAHPQLHWFDDESSYLLCPWHQGQRGSAFLSNESLDLLTVVRVLQQLSGALRRLHRCGYILTSLRPSSFSVDLSGPRLHVWLEDMLNLCETVDRPPYPLSTPYTAPEVGDLVPADEGVDIYSIGALLHRAVSRRELTANRSARSFLPSTDAEQSPMVAQILTRTLGLPSERFFDVAELEKALQQLEQELIPRLRIEIALRSSTGLNPLRIVNQDSGGFVEQRSVHRSRTHHLGFYCVADGMGGHEDGDRASELAVQGALRCFQQMLLELESEQWAPQLAQHCKRIAAAGSRHLVETIHREGGGRRMGTTFTGVLLHDDKLALAHLGDSRAILQREHKMTVLSEDHSLVGMMVKAGQLTIEQAERSDEKNILMRSIGADHIVRAEHFDGFDVAAGSTVLSARPGDRIVLVSDGVWGMIPRPEMEELIDQHSAAAALAQELCQESIKRGGVDNVVVLVLSFELETPF
ncbi:MAG: protein phosphatase 2C domain-containing protein [Myxococcota bacterium]|jgi:serine/threonine protein phosphatase PrpC|nr:protein phosphatase 2C domain-containing protein [Myxococcota bacterium]